MKLSEKIASYTSSRPFYTFEFFPPRTDQGFENLVPRITRMAGLNPLAVSVTWGAGGSTKDRSLELAGIVQREHCVDTILHLTCTNMEQGMVDEALRAAKDRGIRNILALRGDPPRGEEDWIATDDRFTNGKSLVSYIRSTPEFASEFAIGVAAYPDGHPESSLTEEEEIANLKDKVDAGADFIITQLFYDVEGFLRWLQKIRDAGITVPVIPGIMPIQTYASFQRLIKLCGSRVPPSIMAELQPIFNDDQMVKNYGVTLAVSMLRKLSASGIKGFHFCTLNLEKSIQRVLETLKWTGPSTLEQNKLIVDSELTVSPHNATGSAKMNLMNLPEVEGEAGKGELNNAATWDDFPNGRFGDFKSPAYGDQGPWGGLLISRSEALIQWGRPKSVQDLTTLFVDHLHGRRASTPFSRGPLIPESQMIISQLERLNERGWWTVGSQPAVDGIDSGDPIIGWGPRSGYVFQKGFVEFFCETKDVDGLEKRLDTRGKGWVHLIASNFKGEVRTNIPEGARNAVTWGVFPGQEIVQSTIIEQASFLNWKEEAFAIWSEWSSFYRPGSEERKLLENVRDTRWLVSIVHHDYKKADALWQFLFDGQ
ncbi:hypothetical protein EYR36_001068 [Pleurotus pulmonarius]|nr:hypothetical protein EYR36_004309 [Pleurotus pulmonarius]KAF4579258.1 hypothetical protein EYR36_001068 [Pleurotus pulmonarius]KAF4603402.1 hypothetical protein EYR38_003815 [Pleurotus pulmonarius]